MLSDPLHTPVELEPSPPQVLVGRPLSPKPMLQVYVACTPYSYGITALEYVICPLEGLDRDGHVTAARNYYDFFKLVQCATKIRN